MINLEVFLANHNPHTRPIIVIVIILTIWVAAKVYKSFKERTNVKTKKIFTKKHKLGTSKVQLEGKTYKTIIIGKQEWMAENLNVGQYNNGDPIPHIRNTDEWSELNIGAWCYYKNRKRYAKKYGRLYNWYAVNDPRGLAPKGWHVPTKNDIDILIEYLGGDYYAGGAMKKTGLLSWKFPNKGATNDSGFSAKGGGSRDFDGKFKYFRRLGAWWASSESERGAWAIGINYDVGYANIGDNNSEVEGYSVRCIRNKEVI